MVDDLIQDAAQLILQSTKAIALTGAGVSTKSGIPDFRGPDGLWAKVDPVKFASFEGFLSDPKGWWETALELAPVIIRAKPNPAHTMLARLEKMGFLHTLITQNVDELHQKAGTKNVLEVHGSLWRGVCILCSTKVGRKHLERVIKKRQIPPMCPSCGGLLRMDTVFFGEQLPRDVFAKAVQAVQDCDLMLTVGSSLLVVPVATFPSMVKQKGAQLIIINQEPTPYDGVADLVFHSEAGDTLAKIVAAIHKVKSK